MILEDSKVQLASFMVIFYVFKFMQFMQRTYTVSTLTNVRTLTPMPDLSNNKSTSTSENIASSSKYTRTGSFKANFNDV